MLSVTVGTSEDTYACNGRSGDINLLLWPINFSLAYVGFTVLEPFVAYGVEAGLRYSEPSVVEARLNRIADELKAIMANPDRIATVPFNKMSDTGAGPDRLTLRHSVTRVKGSQWITPVPASAP